MKKNNLITMILIIFLAGFHQTVAAQFNIKIPKINKPKVEQPKPEQMPDAKGNSPTPTTTKKTESRSSQSHYLTDPEFPKTPQFLLETLEIRAHNEDKYVKAPSQNDYSSWLPQVNFDVLYAIDSPKLRYQAEWFNPDGSLWFSEPLEYISSSGDFPRLRSPYESVDVNPKAIVAVGTYSLKLTDMKTSQVVFQGKFKVGKMLLNPKEPRYKNQAMFYVDNDWSLPIGYVGFNWNDSWDFDPSPTVYLWFKGELKPEDFEARLFHNNQQVASTDDGGSIGEGGTFAEKRNPDSCFQNTENCRYILWSFKWKNFRVESFDPVKHQLNSGYTRSEPNALYTKDKPGEYTVKIFYKGTQVRETKFTVQPNGYLAPNAYASQLPMDNLKIAVPVKIMGTLDKYNAAAWKTDAFYGNPLSGFVAP